jgi:hypothetical protein
MIASMLRRFGMAAVISTLIITGILASGASAALQTPAAAQPAANPTVLTVALPAKLIPVGQTITATITIDTTPATRGIQLGMDFDPAVLRCVSVDEGTFYKNWARANGGDTYFSIMSQPTCDNTNGHVSDAAIAVTTMQAGGAMGQGVVMTYTFERVGNGPSVLHLKNVIVANDNTTAAQPLPTTVNDGQVDKVYSLYTPLIRIRLK